jgi:hypothetical protein
MGSLLRLGSVAESESQRLLVGACPRRAQWVGQGQVTQEE